MPRSVILILLTAIAIGTSSGCSLIFPEVAQQPVIRNPFPQLRRVAVAPFFNQSDEPTVDGREVGMAYFAELQSTPGFEVVPLGVVEEAIIANRVDLSSAGEARRLAQILGVDAVVVGSVTDFSEYYPPRIGLRVEWYAANPGFHEIPAGYGLPWNTPEEEYIPDSLVYESQMAAARSKMAGLSPDCEEDCQALPEPPSKPPLAPSGGDGATEGDPLSEPPAAPAAPAAPADASPLSEPATPPTKSAEPGAVSTVRNRGKSHGGVQLAQAEEELPACAAGGTVTTVPGGACPTPSAVATTGARPECIPYDGPVLSHTRIYRGNDADVVEALEGYASFRNDERFGGWKTYLRRSDDFTRFCCHMNIAEMLSARGGSRKTQVVWRWPESR